MSVPSKEMSSSAGILVPIQPNPISQHHHINIPSASQTNSPQPRPLNLPRQDLLDDGRRDEFLEICLPLYKASMRGDWEIAEDILDKHKELVRFSINRNNETALHVAAYRGNTLFVENLMSLMENEDLELQNSSSNTALCLATVAGHVKVAEILVTKYKALLNITGSQEKMPLYMAALSGKKDMVKYLYENSERMTGSLWTDESRGRILLACVEAGLFDVALQIVKDRPELVVRDGSVLGVLARKHGAFKKEYNFIERFVFLHDDYDGLVDEGNQAMKLLRIIWGNIMKLPKAKIDDILRGRPDEITNKYSSRVLFVAAEMGNTAFIVELIRQYPEQVLALNDNKQSIFHIAVTHRYRGIYSLLHDIGSMQDSIVNLEDENGNNMLHLVGILSETARSYQFKDIPGPASQLLKDLAWFQVV
ncbi:hypothetical protein L1887_26852 [Cichorium endivia]|nr:hypothetical protein L1887_26852 [Cichorium endivia]